MSWNNGLFQKRTRGLGSELQQHCPLGFGRSDLKPLLARTTEALGAFGVSSPQKINEFDLLCHHHIIRLLFATGGLREFGRRGDWGELGPSPKNWLPIAIIHEKNWWHLFLFFSTFVPAEQCEINKLNELKFFFSPWPSLDRWTVLSKMVFLEMELKALTMSQFSRHNVVGKGGDRLWLLCGPFLHHLASIHHISGTISQEFPRVGLQEQVQSLPTSWELQQHQLDGSLCPPFARGMKREVAMMLYSHNSRTRCCCCVGG